MPTGLSSKTPWFSWMGGPHLKETPNVGVWDSVAWLHLGYSLGKVGHLCHPTWVSTPTEASLQFANPLHARFILHLCGFSAKGELCRFVQNSLRKIRGNEGKAPAATRKMRSFWNVTSKNSFLVGVVERIGHKFHNWYNLAAACSTGTLLYSVYIRYS